MTSGLGHRFWNIWTTFSAANLGDGFNLVAFPLMAITLTDDARAVALVSVFRFLPFVVLGLPAGVVMDRFDRRVLAIGAQLGRTGAMAAAALLVASGAGSIAWLATLAFATGVGEVVADGTVPAMVQKVVAPDRLEVANSRLSATQTVTNLFVGPPVGALLFGIEPALPFATAALLYLVAAGLLWLIRGEFSPATDTDTGIDDQAGADATAGPFRRFRGDLTVGLRYVWRHPVLRPLALSVALFSFVGEAGNAVYVILATRRFGLTDFQFGLLVGVDGVVSVLMSFAVASFVRRTSHSISMRFAVITYSIAALIQGLSTFPVAIWMAAVFLGLSDPSWNVVSGTVRQRLVPTGIFGRMMTAYLFIAWGMQPIGALLGGVVAQRWGPQWVFVISAAAVFSLLILARPMFRAVDRAMAADGEARHQL